MTDLLNEEFFSNDLEKTLTYREYFIELLTRLWVEGEGFSGKRPFGNSSWQYDIFAGLVKNGRVEGRLDEYGYLDWCNTAKANAIIQDMIQNL